MRGGGLEAACECEGEGGDMSLDVYLELEREPATQVEHSGIFVREGGSNKEITREEWDRRFPDREPMVLSAEPVETEVWHGNITHNLNIMAGQADLYQYLWRPDEIGVTEARELIDPLREGLLRLIKRPDYFKQWNPENGWGDYEGLVQFVRDYLEACECWPEAKVRVWR